MDCITPDLLAVMNSLTKRYNESRINGWGKTDESIDDILPPTDWRLKAIKAFRTRVNLAEMNHQEMVINAIRDELAKRGIKRTQDKIDYLYKAGLSDGRIARFLKIPKSAVTTRIMILRKGDSRFTSRNTLNYIDALTLIRNDMTALNDKTFKSFHY